MANPPTPENDVSQMQAGRELDALVAEKVMGWDMKVRPEWGSRIVSGPFKDCDCVSHNEAAVVPDYSTDIAAAWLVVNKMRERGWILTDLRQFLMGATDGERDWGAKFEQFMDGEAEAECIEADTPALAICRAALLAVGVAHG